MDKINFENLPSTNTPVNAENLNGMQNNIEKSVNYIGSSQPNTNEKIWIKKGKNLVKQILNGIQITSNGGVEQKDNDWCSTKYISVVSGQQYYASGFSSSSMFWYDSNKTYISRTTTNPTTAPANAAFVRLNSTIAGLSNPMLHQGSSSAPFENYIDKEILIKNSNNVFEEFYNENNAEEQYSYGEQKIGTWIDGRTLYRSVFKTAEFLTDYYLGIANAQNIISIKGMVHRKDYDSIYSPIPSRLSNTNYFVDFDRVERQSSNIGVKLLWGSSYTADKINDIIFIIEYTKTTD